MDILMPQLGETVAEGKITKWFKSTGDSVQPGDNLFEIETDKTSMEVPATSAGVLAEICVATGDVAPVGAVVAVLAASAEAAAAHKPSEKSAAPLAPVKAETQVAAQQNGSGAQAAPAPRTVPMDLFREVRTPERNYGPARVGGISVTPLARRLAGENGIDLSRVTGSGPHGRIVARDVEMQGKRAPVTAMSSGPSSSDILALYRDMPYEEVPLDGMRRTIATRLTQAKQTVPHFYLNTDVSIDALLKVRADANTAAPRPEGAATYRLSVNDFIIKALALALMRVPAANAVWADDRILRFNRADIGVAVAIEAGLLTPVLRAVNEKSLSTISNEMRALATRARDKKLMPEEYQGGVSAISNLGMYGVRDFSAIINPPQSTILAVGAAQRRPVETEDGGVRFESQMTITLSCDHRVVDGALGAQLLAAVKGYLEQPVTMLV